MTTYQEPGKHAQIVKSYYNPEVEFLEIGVSRGDDLAWKIYGADSNGIYGGLQGIGGLQAIVNACSFWFFNEYERIKTFLNNKTQLNNYFFYYLTYYESKKY